MQLIQFESLIVRGLNGCALVPLGVYEKSDKPPHLAPKISAKTKRLISHLIRTKRYLL
nr:MAG TPA: hypothetical protein [Bacteriophage sp.]